jgi:hypothetical protein
MLDIISYLPNKRKKSASGWISFNAPCCIHNGETHDTKGRGGIIQDGDGWIYHCFNCGFKTGFMMGKPVGIKTRKLLNWLGVPETEIAHLTLESLRNKSIDDILHNRNAVSSNVSFNTVDYPLNSKQITVSDVNFVGYLDSRGLDYMMYPYHITPMDGGRNANRIIVPYMYKDKLVGYTSRFLDDRHPKYLNEQQPGYIFGLDFQRPEWNIAIVVEGVFDAISIDGIAVLHNEISEVQAMQLKRVGKEIIVVPDQDKAGLKLIDQALDNSFSVSIPLWDQGIKDVNDAVIEYGKLGTLMYIMKYRKTSSIKIKLAKKALQKRINERV